MRFSRHSVSDRLLHLLQLAGLCLLLALLPQSGRADGDAVTLNLKDADIGTVIGTISEATGKNFIVDPRVKGKVTVISSKPLKADELYQVFLAVLNVHGFAAVPDGGVIKIVPEVTAKQSAIPNATDRDPGIGDEYVTRVIGVDNVAATQLVPILRPLLPQEAHLAAYPGSNVLIASASAANIGRIVELIQRIDRSDDSEIEIIPLQHASAEEVVRILTTMMQDPGKAAQNPTEMPKLGADLRTNSVLVSGDRGTRQRLRSLINNLDTPMERTGSTQVVYLRYAKAKDLVPVLTGLSSASKGAQSTQGAAKTGETLNIQADDSINALVINAPPDIMRNLEQVIRRLDIRRAQVLVEAIVAEVTADTARELGVQWAFDASAKNGPVGIINFAGSGSGLASFASSAASGTPSVGDGLLAAVGDTAASGGTRIAALLRALSGDVNTNILSTPSLVTMDNQEAEIVVGQNVPFVTGSYTSTGSGSTPTNPFQTISRQDVGLSLKIKPQINEGDAVKLDIDQEVSSISSATTGATDIVTNKRAIKTSVMVDSGQIVVLGGLIDDQLVQNEQKVPGLGDIPILGYFFSYKKTTKVKRNLMVFIHPIILRNADDNLAVTGNKYDYIRNQQLGVRERGVKLMSDDVTPILPAWNDRLAVPPSLPPVKKNDDAKQPSASGLPDVLDQPG